MFGSAQFVVALQFGVKKVRRQVPVLSFLHGQLKVRLEAIDMRVECEEERYSWSLFFPSANVDVGGDQILANAHFERHREDSERGIKRGKNRGVLQFVDENKVGLLFRNEFDGRLKDLET